MIKVSVFSILRSRYNDCTQCEQKTYSNEKIKGFLHDVTDNSLTIVPKMSRQALELGQYEGYSMQYDHIKVIKLRRKGNSGRCFGIGFLAGFTTGVIHGFIEGDAPAPHVPQILM